MTQLPQSKRRKVTIVNLRYRGLSIIEEADMLARCYADDLLGEYTRVMEMTHEECVNDYPHLVSASHQLMDEIATNDSFISTMPDTSVERAVYVMKSYQLRRDYAIEMRRLIQQAPKEWHECTECNVPKVWKPAQGTWVCPHCGQCDTDHNVVDRFDYYMQDTYNCRPRHHYCIQEYFHQVLLDFTGLGRRNIPDVLVDTCRRAMRDEPSPSNFQVFEVMRTMGPKYRQYYNMRYVIASILRGGRHEFQFSGDDLFRAKLDFSWYALRMYEYHLSADIANISSRGRCRVIFPSRFMLRKVMENIGREDVVAFIAPIRGKKRLERYSYYWNDMEMKYRKPSAVMGTQMEQIDYHKPSEHVTWHS